MIIFSRSRSPWITAAFIVIVSLGAYFRWQSSLEEEEQRNITTKQLFIEFEAKAQKALHLTDEQKGTGLLYEVFKCRKPDAGERKYCNKVADKFFNLLTPEQRENFKPLVEEYFSK